MVMKMKRTTTQGEERIKYKYNMTYKNIKNTKNLQRVQVIVFIHPEVGGNNAQLLFGSIQTNKDQEGAHTMTHHTQQWLDLYIQTHVTGSIQWKMIANEKTVAMYHSVAIHILCYLVCPVWAEEETSGRCWRFQRWKLQQGHGLQSLLAL